MRVGDKVTEMISEATTHNFGGSKIKKQGTVIWIHPKLRFYRVEFDFGCGKKFRESFMM